MSKVIFNIVLSGFLLALAILLGVFAKFPLFGGSVYLVGLVIFIMPIFLKLPYAFLTGSIAVVLVDVLTGWAQFSWISFLAYGASILILWLFIKLKLKIAYMLGLLIAMGVNLLIYYALTSIVIDKAYGVATLISTSIQFAILLPLNSLLYYPLKLVSTLLPH